MKIKEMSEELKPRERFLKSGPEVLSEAELLAIILRTGTIKENVVEMSSRIISEFGLDNLFDCSLKELQEIKGIGPSKAMQILAIAELVKRQSHIKNKIKKITQAKDVYDYFKDKLQNQKQENFYILLLNTKNHIIKEEFITRGILDSAIIHPREIFRPAIKNSASKIILIHNHPSGDPTPSEEDLEITKELIEVGDKIGIKVLDHVIVGKENESESEKNRVKEDRETRVDCAENRKYWSWVEGG